MYRLTFFLLGVVLVTLAFSAMRHSQPTRAEIASQKRPDYKIRNERFPTAAYSEQDFGDPEQNAKRREKQKRYNDKEFVFSRVDPWVEESVLNQHISFPPLPVNESEIIAVGTILTGEAHLSESRRNVFSEFTLAVEKVLKPTDPRLVPGSVLTIDRIGGHVRYANGQRVLFRIAGLNMPQIGGRYLFFLTSKHNKQDLSIVTAYELTQSGSIPLDELPEVANLMGTTEAEILQKVRELIQNSAK